MKLNVLQFLSRLRSSYWFLPAIMGLGAILLSVGTTLLDLHLGTDWSDKTLGVFSNRPEGARAFLGTVAASMITVAGVTFSLTILAVSHASSQYGPRILTNFMRDRSNQTTLGTFIATFLYCLLILRTVRGADESVATSNIVIGAFVPHVSIIVALFLSLISVTVLISFFHHIPESIRLSNVVEDVGRQLLKKIRDLFPQSIGENLEESKARIGKDPSAQNTHPVGTPKSSVSQRDGYIQAIDSDRLLEKAREHDVVIELIKKPGDFVSSGTLLFKIWTKEMAVSVDKIETDVRHCYAWGNSRTSTQDVMYLVDELVEVSARALSPGVNDPFTAMNCIDWLESGLSSLAGKATPEGFRYDKSGALRVIAPTIGFTDICKSIGNSMRPYVSTDRMAALYYLNSLGALNAKLQDVAQQACLDGLATSLIEMCEANGMFIEDLRELKQLKGELFTLREKTKVALA